VKPLENIAGLRGRLRTPEAGLGRESRKLVIGGGLRGGVQRGESL
jgi:hypothetical protein